jgi:hypothetical protein
MTDEKRTWEMSQEMALRITADYFRLRDLRDALADVEGMAKVMIRSDLSIDDYQMIVSAMSVQQTIIAARLRLNVEAYRNLAEGAKNPGDWMSPH